MLQLFNDYVLAANTYFTLRKVIENLPIHPFKFDAKIRPDDAPVVDNEPDWHFVRSWLAFEKTLDTNADATYQPPTQGGE
jgi:hypothetical protein